MTKKAAACIPLWPVQATFLFEMLKCWPRLSLYFDLPRSSWTNENSPHFSSCRFMLMLFKNNYCMYTMECLSSNNRSLMVYECRCLSNTSFTCFINFYSWSVRQLVQKSYKTSLKIFRFRKIQAKTSENKQWLLHLMYEQDITSLTDVVRLKKRTKYFISFKL